MLWVYILQGLGFGFAAAVQPGPFQTYLISETLTKGWQRALPVVLSPFISDGPIIALSLLVLSQLPNWLERALYLVGGLFILYLAWGAYRAWRAFDPGQSTSATSNQTSMLKGALMIVISPGPYIYWSLVTGPVLLRGWRESPMFGLGFLAGFYSMLMIGLVSLVLVFGKARELGPKMNRALIGLSVIALTGFGLYQLWLALNGTS